MSDRGITVDAPSALLGFSLALRLERHDARVVELPGGRCSVQVAADAPRAWVLDCVRRWLDQESLRQVVVHVEGESYTVTQTGTQFSD
jgi:hypothetical protein